MVANNTTDNKHVNWFLVNGTCMSPVIKQGDIVLTRPLGEPRVGDLVVIRGDPVLVHRVIKIQQNNYITTKGDASFRLDPPVHNSNIAGKVTAIVRKGEGTNYVVSETLYSTSRLTALYSCFSLCIFNALSRYHWSSYICKFLSPIMHHLHLCVLKIISSLNTKKASV